MNSWSWMVFLQGTFYSLLLGMEAVLLYVTAAIIFGYFLCGSSKKIILLDLFIALPNQLLLLVLAGLLGGGWNAFLFAVGVTQFPSLVRHIRSYLVQALREECIESVRALGASELRVLIFHVMPRIFSPLAVISLALMKRVILSEALLTFLGLGFDPLTPSLGRLLSEGKEALFVDPLRFVAPAVALILLLWILQALSDRFSHLFNLPGVRYL